VEEHDVVIEGFRPGVAERRGVGPDAALSRTPRLVYGRMTGGGQDGPLSQAAGHDITYLALSGALEPVCGADGAPVPPLNLLGDFGGGGMSLAVGVLAALWHARECGEGQVVDASILDGTALLTVMHQSMLASGTWSAPRGHNVFDGGAPFYRVYRTRDDRYVAVGAIEPAFLAALLDGLGLSEDPVAAQAGAPEHWPAATERLAEVFAQRDRDEWAAVFADRDACVAPVLSPDEAAAHPHLSARGTYLDVDGIRHPAPTPRFSRTPLDPPRPARPIRSVRRAGRR